MQDGGMVTVAMISRDACKTSIPGVELAGMREIVAVSLTVVSVAPRLVFPRASISLVMCVSPEAKHM